MTIYGELAGKAVGGAFDAFKQLLVLVFLLMVLVVTGAIVAYRWGYSRGVTAGRAQIISEQYAANCKANGGIVQAGICVVVTPVP